jgi:hypothetical protein
VTASAADQSIFCFAEGRAIRESKIGRKKLSVPRQIPGRMKPQGRGATRQSAGAAMTREVRLPNLVGRARARGHDP